MFLTLHLIFSIGAVIAIYFHKPTHLLISPAVYLLTAACLQILTVTLRCGQILYRNTRYRTAFSWAKVREITYKRPGESDIPLSDAVHVHVRLTKTWRPRAGQYVYFCIPGVSYASFAQFHPFYVAWCYCHNSHDYAVLIVQRRKGFTDHLFLHRGNEFDEDAEMRAIIEGPYGKELDLHSYGTVLLFATGIGIAGHLAYIAELLSGYHSCEVQARRIAVFWQVDSESEYSLDLYSQFLC